MLLSQIAQFLGLSFTGDDYEINALNTLSLANEYELSFLDNQKYAAELIKTNARAVLVRPSEVSMVPSTCTPLITEEPYLKLALASKLFAPQALEKEGTPPVIASSSTIAPHVYIGFGSVIEDDVILMPGVFIGDNCRIGKGSLLYPNVSVYRDCHIGKECIIHAGTIIGSDGFGFAHTKTGEHIKIYQNGNVVIEDNVEIGANTTIDRAVFGTTLIKHGTKIDNLAQIGHNCIIGEHSIIVAQTGISGSTVLGRNVVMGAQSGAAGHLTIPPFTTIAARGGVTKTLEGGKTYAGFPLFEHREWLKLQAKISGLLKK